jgi:CheY-like chemotaxis protein
MNVQRAFQKNKISNILHVTRNGIEALDFLNNKANPTVQIILLDINMPKMNGLEFLKELRKDDNLKNISVFIMTTSNSESDIIAAHNLNVAGYIAKPLSFESIVQAIKVLNHYWELCERPQK